MSVFQILRHGFAFAVAGLCALSASAVAQAPIAGSGALPALDPLAQSPKIIVDAVAKVMSNRADKRPFLAINACFRESRIQTALTQSCRFRLEAYQRDMLIKYADLFAGLPPLEIYNRLVQLSDDPDRQVISRNLFALSGIVTQVSDARRFTLIKECFNNAGPQPAMRQICEQQLDAFQTELLRTRGVELRDIRPEAIKRRLRSVAMSDQVGFLAGGTSAFDSLRQIRNEQQEKRTAAVTALVQAIPYYCPAPSDGRTPQLSSQLENPGICLCTYGRRYVGSSASLSRSPVRASYAQCGVAARFRVGDLNGGRLRHGDWITLQAVHNGYVSMNRDGIVYANRERAGKGEKFRLIRAVNQPGLIGSGELFVLVSALGAFVVPDPKTGTLKATKQKPAPHEYFVMTPR
mgnify:CR=1 FL=1